MKPQPLLALALAACGGATPVQDGFCGSELRGVDGERCLAALAEETMIAAHGVYEDDALSDYVRAVGERIVDASDRRELSYRFLVLDTPYAQAWALPGGRVMITRGLISQLGSEAELAAVLAHEVGHHAGGHVDRLLDDLNAPEWDDVVALTRALAHDQDQERQADQLAIVFLRRAGYDVRAAGSMLEAVHRAQGGDPSWADRHAPLPVRLALVARAADLDRGGETHVERFHRHVDGLVVGDDPRDGTVRSGSFVHPRAGLRLTVPEDWPEPTVANRTFGAWNADRSLGFGFSTIGRAGAGYVERTLREDLRAHDPAPVRVAGRDALSGWLPEGRGTRVNIADVGVARVAVFEGRDGGVYLLAALGREADREPVDQLFERVVADSVATEDTVAPWRVRPRRLGRASTLGGLVECAPPEQRELLALINGRDLDAPVPEGSFVRCIGH